jgi:hypothetical protein
VRYRKKPVVIDAMQLDAQDYDGMCQIAGWCGGRPIDAGGHVLAIDTLEGTMYADPGDWIVRSVQGEFYPCKSDIFEATYEPVVAKDSCDV